MFSLSLNVAIYGERVTIILGLITLTSGMATFFSCRSFISLLGLLRIHSPADNKTYRSFNKYHAYYWWAFITVFVLHLMTALVHTSIPSASDPDAAIHRLILWFGVASFVSSLVVISSCRSIPGIIYFFTEKNSLSNRVYQKFFKYHSYYWWVFILAVAGHFAASFYHTGIWPV
jgi:cytochrome b561